MYNNSHNCKGFVYVVKDGDTLYKIAKEYDLKLIDILNSNPYVNVYNLQPGDELCLPTMPNSMTWHNMDRMKDNRMNDMEENVYVTREGDTLRDILEYFNTDYMMLAEYNPAFYDLPVPEGTIVHEPKEKETY